MKQELLKKFQDEFKENCKFAKSEKYREVLVKVGSKIVEQNSDILADAENLKLEEFVSSEKVLRKSVEYLLDELGIEVDDTIKSDYIDFNMFIAKSGCIDFNSIESDMFIDADLSRAKELANEAADKFCSDFITELNKLDENTLQRYLHACSSTNKSIFAAIGNVA